ncbi:hypothetical protein [Microbispora rosea]|uniref:hypothetical protein n=1 Tax=Microbispora rosea TaxID=58117 RepID=UPI003D910ACE
MTLPAWSVPGSSVPAGLRAGGAGPRRGIGPDAVILGAPAAGLSTARDLVFGRALATGPA